MCIRHNLVGISFRYKLFVPESKLMSAAHWNPCIFVSQGNQRINVNKKKNESCPSTNAVHYASHRVAKRGDKPIFFTHRMVVGCANIFNFSCVKNCASHMVLPVPEITSFSCFLLYYVLLRIFYVVGTGCVFFQK